MNAAHFHLAVNHFPVVLFFFGAIVLILSFVVANPFWRKTACFIIFAAAISSVPALLTGEGAEHFVEKLGRSESLIGPHEKSAKVAFACGLVSGVLATATWFAMLAGNRFLRHLSLVLALMSIFTSAAYFYASFQGGKIAHKEIRENGAAQNIIKLKQSESDD